MTSTYDAVNDSPYFKNWFSGLLELSPDNELISDMSLIKLRQSSRKLVKNNFMAWAAQQAYVNTIVGGKISVDIVSKNKKLNKELEDMFYDERTYDLNRNLTLTQLTEVIVNSAFVDGDVLINLPIDNRYTGDLKTYVELIEASRIKTPPKFVNNPLVREGVEYFSSGRIKGYHVIKTEKYDRYITYTSATDDDFDFLPCYKSNDLMARRVCYLFKAPLNLRSNQSRQVPVLTGIMGLLKYFNQYLEAVLVGSRVAACFSAFVKTNNPSAARKSLAEDIDDHDINIKGKKLTKLQPGIISYLRMNEDITFASPNRPSDNFDSFVLRLSKFVASTLRIPYEQLFLDLSQTNYSSWRGGSLEIERNVNRWRRDLDFVLRWILFTYIREGVSKDVIKSKLNNSNMIMQIVFPKYKSLDEEKTARARRLDLQNKVTSIHRVQSELGQDYDALQGELDLEIDAEVEREARRLVKQKELSEELDILFPEQVAEQNANKRDTSSTRRPGESAGEDLDEEDARERRKEDGNW